MGREALQEASLALGEVHEPDEAGRYRLQPAASTAMLLLIGSNDEGALGAMQSDVFKLPTHPV
ncbi:MAG: hypothetical protein EON54_01905 [Alcaligenaceae bacterium]|nr:MAG: hypothetical protein EON54_01905 [Alcaligenaceae bacterium]